MKDLKKLMFAASLATLACQPVFAEEMPPADGEAPQFGMPPEGLLIAGVTAASNYMIGGVSLSGNQSSLQPFIEYNFPFGLYVGGWAANGIVDVDGNKWEYDYFMGYRGMLLDGLHLDTSYWVYNYDKTAYFGEAAFVNLDYDVSRKLSMGLGVKHDTFFDNQVFTARFKYDLGNGWSVSGKEEAVNKRSTLDVGGGYEVELQSGTELNWDLGLTHQFDRIWSVDLRAFDSNFEDPNTGDTGSRFVLAINAYTDLLH
ncbi:TorF family putative porin [Oceanobacter kriegii]|uniref:TorF family putative porin n=1 Tax=Oceanobacter kriegii TaxID=64972 RepID=UPI0004276200|nr:TorF family putative porin [Oceanobacter kriegii]